MQWPRMYSSQKSDCRAISLNLHLRVSSTIRSAMNSFMQPSVSMMKPLSTELQPFLCSHSHLTWVVGSSFRMISGFLLQGSRLMMMQSGDTYRQNSSLRLSRNTLGFCSLASNWHSAQLKSVSIDILQLQGAWGGNEMSYMIIEAVLGAALLAHCACIQIMMMKDNIFVPQGTRYEYELTIQQTENNLNPFSNMTLNHTIANSITTTQQYFDYFPYLSKGDKICYQDAVGNMSYLFPCSFLHNSLPFIRTSHTSDTNTFETFRGLNSEGYHFVVDNTPFPFPIGAEPYSDLIVSSTTSLELFIQEQYYTLGIRLIFINVTVLLIYATVIVVLVCRIKHIKDEMKVKDFESTELKHRLSDISKDMDEESDADNYEEMMHNEFSMRDSRTGHLPSLISSNHSPPALSFRRFP